MDIFPDNKRSTFKVRLPQTQYLGPDWVVGLTEISYTLSWFNISSMDHQFKVSSPGFHYPEERDRELKIPSSYYDSPESLVRTMNKLVDERINKRKNVLTPCEFEVTPEMTFRMKRTGTYRFLHNDNTFTEPEINFKYTPDLLPVLGHDGKEFNNPINLNQEYTSLYCYCDAVYPSIIGDTMGPLLRVVTVDNTVPFGTTVNQIFEEPYYVPLNTQSFQELAVYIRTDTGKAPHFEFGRVVLTLHFKRKNAL
jgi:hypothetical protein